jgi:hypothetical protein
MDVFVFTSDGFKVDSTVSSDLLDILPGAFIWTSPRSVAIVPSR